MENAEEVLHYLEDFTKRKPKTIPQELNEYLAHVARTGDPIYQWSIVKALFKEKLLNVITDFYETTPGLDIPTYPNVDPFNYDIMKNSLLERLDSFNAAPFTVQRICELLTFPRKQYNRIDKFMRAVEKNILVVSTREPGPQRMDIENGEAHDPIVNGSDNNSDYNVDVEMDDMSWKEKCHDPLSEPQPSSSDAHISVDDIEARLQSKKDSIEAFNKASDFISLTPPDNDQEDEPLEKLPEPELVDTNNTPEEPSDTVHTKEDVTPEATPSKTQEPPNTPMVIPEITIDDAEMTEQKLTKQASLVMEEITAEKLIMSPPEEPKEQKESEAEIQSEVPINGHTSETKEDIECSKLSDLITSSEESSSSSDNTDGASNSPKPIPEELGDNSNTLPEESFKPDTPIDNKLVETAAEAEKSEDVSQPELVPLVQEQEVLQSENYSISDVNSELPQPETVSDKPESKTEEIPPTDKVESVDIPKNTEQMESEAKVVDEKGDA